MPFKLSFETVRNSEELQKILGVPIEAGYSVIQSRVPGNMVKLTYWVTGSKRHQLLNYLGNSSLPKKSMMEKGKVVSYSTTRTSNPEIIYLAVDVDLHARIVLVGLQEPLAK